MQQGRLMRSETDKMIAGVCGGLAEYLNTDPVLVRLGFVLLLLASGVGLAMYLLLWVILPTPSRAQPVIRLMDQEVGKSGDTLSRFSPAATVGIILILFGAFFLFSQFGWTNGVIWPLLLIGAGLFYLVRRSRS